MRNRLHMKLVYLLVSIFLCRRPPAPATPCLRNSTALIRCQHDKFWGSCILPPINKEAPNRPPSAPAGGGQNSIKRKAAVPAGHRNHLSKDKLCFILFEAPLRKCRCHYAPVPTGICSFRRSHTANEMPASHSGRKLTLALRGAEGDRRAQRGSSRSRGRAALGQWWNMENP